MAALSADRDLRQMYAIGLMAFVLFLSTRVGVPVLLRRISQHPTAAR